MQYLNYCCLRKVRHHWCSADVAADVALMWHVACTGWVAPKDRDSASQLIRYTIAFTVAGKKYLRSEAVHCCPFLISSNSWAFGAGGVLPYRMLWVKDRILSWMSTLPMCVQGVIQIKVHVGSSQISHPLRT